MTRCYFKRRDRFLVVSLDLQHFADALFEIFVLFEEDVYLASRVVVLAEHIIFCVRLAFELGQMKLPGSPVS